MATRCAASPARCDLFYGGPGAFQSGGGDSTVVHSETRCDGKVDCLALAKASNISTKRSLFYHGMAGVVDMT